MDTEARLADIRARISAAQQAEARNDLLRERALADRDEAMKSLKAEFDVESVDEAILLRKELKAQLDAFMEVVENALDALGA